MAAFAQTTAIVVSGARTVTDALAWPCSENYYYYYYYYCYLLLLLLFIYLFIIIIIIMIMITIIIIIIIINRRGKSAESPSGAPARREMPERLPIYLAS